MSKPIKHGVINSTDEQNLYIIDSLTLEGWIKARNDAPDAPFHFENTALYIIKMLEFKCIDLNMDMNEIMRLFHVSKKAFSKIIIKYHNYSYKHDINYPNFIVGANNIPDICSVIKYYIKSQEQYEK